MARDEFFVHTKLWPNTKDAYAEAENSCEEFVHGDDFGYAAIVEYFDSPWPVPDGELGELWTFESLDEEVLQAAIKSKARGREYDIQYETATPYMEDD